MIQRTKQIIIGKKIEEKVFHIEKKYEKNKHYTSTVPAPFNLTSKRIEKK